MARIDHTLCTHPRTPAGRRACRGGRPTFNESTGVLDRGTPKVKKPKPPTAAELGIEVPEVAPRRRSGSSSRVRAHRSYEAQRNASRADPRCTCDDGIGTVRIHSRKCPMKSVSVRISGCIQEQLHVGSGTCACGWVGTGCGCGNQNYRDTVTGPSNGFCGPTYCHYALAN